MTRGDEQNCGRSVSPLWHEVPQRPARSAGKAFCRRQNALADAAYTRNFLLPAHVNRAIIIKDTIAKDTSI